MAIENEEGIDDRSSEVELVDREVFANPRVQVDVQLCRPLPEQSLLSNQDIQHC
jgi:hypothetical protein